MRITQSVGLLALLSIAAATTSDAQVEARYAKTEVRVPMRDGTQLFTVVYAPRDTTRRYPIMMTRTPYSVGPYGPNAYPRAVGPSPRFADEGFIFVYQDVRGRFMPHTGFRNPACPSEFVPRESIEARTLVVFDQAA